MAARAANITSIEAIRTFATAMMAFEDGAEDAAVQLELEARRPVAWIDELSAYWPKEVRKASDNLSEARILEILSGRREGGRTVRVEAVERSQAATDALLAEVRTLNARLGALDLRISELREDVRRAK